MITRALSLIAVICFIPTAVCAKSDASTDSCEKWPITAGKALNVVPEKRFNEGLKQIHKGCGKLIPDVLTNAAGEALKVSSSLQRFSIYTTATKSYYKEVCFDITPGKPAEYLFDFCLEGDYPDGDYSGMLQSIDAAVYLYLKAVERELKNNMVKTRESEFYIKKFMQNLFLAAAMDYEREHKR